MYENKNDLIENLHKLHTTDMGAVRIKRNLALCVEDVVLWCKEKIPHPRAVITREGKNWYVEIEGCVITVNAHSFTLITAHKIKNKKGITKMKIDVEARLKEIGEVLPPPPPKGGLYQSCKLFGANLAYVSGCGCIIDGPVAGKLGIDFTMEEGMVFAKDCMLNVLSVLKDKIGDLSRVKSCVKILVFVASADDFYSQPAVANGATKLLGEIFGEEVGIPSRSAIGVNVLPGNLPVEIEAMFEIE